MNSPLFQGLSGQCPSRETRKREEERRGTITAKKSLVSPIAGAFYEVIGGRKGRLAQALKDICEGVFSQQVGPGLHAKGGR